MMSWEAFFQLMLLLITIYFMIEGLINAVAKNTTERMKVIQQGNAEIKPLYKSSDE